MRPRHVLLLASGAGAAGALLLAADIHRRVQEAQREMVLNTSVPGSDSILHFGDAHMLGLLALAFLFIAFFLLIFSEPLRKGLPEQKSTSTVTPTPAQEPAPPKLEVSALPSAPAAPPTESSAVPIENKDTPLQSNPPSVPAPQPVSNDASAASGLSDSESNKAHER